MSASLDRAGEFLRANAAGVGAALALLAGGVGAVRFVVKNRAGPPPPRKVMQFTMVNLPPPPAAKPPPPPVQPREEVQEHATRVNLKPSDFVQPDLSRPAPAAGGGGRLSLAAEGSGPGDAFNLVGNPGGRGLLSGGGLGDGSGDELGEGGGAQNRFGWYYARMAGEIESAFRRKKELAAASARVELRIWAEPDGRISRLELIRSTGEEKLDAAIRSVVGTRLSEPPPRDLPMPMIARLTVRRVAQ